MDFLASNVFIVNKWAWVMCVGSRCSWGIVNEGEYPLAYQRKPLDKNHAKSLRNAEFCDMKGDGEV